MSSALPFLPILPKSREQNPSIWPRIRAPKASQPASDFGKVYKVCTQLSKRGAPQDFSRPEPASDFQDVLLKQLPSSLSDRRSQPSPELLLPSFSDPRPQQSARVTSRHLPSAHGLGARAQPDLDTVRPKPNTRNHFSGQRVPGMRFLVVNFSVYAFPAPS